MATELKFPQIIITSNQWRLVAVGLTKQAPGTNSGHHYALPTTLGVIDVVSEQCSKDSMGNETWTTCSFNDASAAILRSMAAENFVNLMETSKSSKKTSADASKKSTTDPK